MTAARRKRHPGAPPAPRKGDAIDEQARRGGGLRRLPDLLGRVLDPAARRRGLAEAKLLTEWPAIVGPGLAARCQPVRLSQRSDRPGGVLLLHVAGAAALELQHSEPQVLERINGFFGFPAVSRLQLIQAPVKRAAARSSAAPGSCLTSADEADLAAAVSTVGDPGLQAALAALGRTLKLQGATPRGGTLPAEDTEPPPTGLG